MRWNRCWTHSRRVLVDIEMPRMDGFDLTLQRSRRRQTGRISRSSITSRTADKHRNYAFEIGVNNYLGKPYQEDELLRWSPSMASDTDGHADDGVPATGLRLRPALAYQRPLARRRRIQRQRVVASDADGGRRPAARIGIATTHGSLSGTAASSGT